MTCSPSCSCNLYHESDVCLCGCDILDEISYKIPEDQWIKENKKRTLIIEELNDFQKKVYNHKHDENCQSGLCKLIHNK